MTHLPKVAPANRSARRLQLERAENVAVRIANRRTKHHRTGAGASPHRHGGLQRHCVRRRARHGWCETRDERVDRARAAQRDERGDSVPSRMSARSLGLHELGWKRGGASFGTCLGLGRAVGIFGAVCSVIFHMQLQTTTRAAGSEHNVAAHSIPRKMGVRHCAASANRERATGGCVCVCVCVRVCNNAAERSRQGQTATT